MGAIAYVLFAVGGIIGLIGGIMFLIVAFKESALWGLGSMFIPFVGLVFLVKFWSDAKKAFFLQLLAIPFYIVGVILIAMVAKETIGNSFGA